MAKTAEHPRSLDDGCSTIYYWVMSPSKTIGDLEYVLARLLEVYPREVADVWLESFNAHLGARPADVLELSGVGRVIAAIEAEAEGAYA